ncbi:large ribosomal subunit protein mL49 [Melanerpes formicivorus]|uniref:large ribosomal subunit protein mL49 n=1 Tax=Melanerpes formicivorus TaxID=211600 RepID=UPI00358E6FE5
MHNLPVYCRGAPGRGRRTELRGIDGDIWELEKQLREFLRSAAGKEPEVKVNEVCGSLLLKGHWGQEVKEWLLEKGF